MEQMEMCRNYFLVLVFAIFVITANGQELKNYKDTQVKFEVLSARVMSLEEQIRKQSDNIGIDVSVRLRLSNTGQTTVFYYTYGNENVDPYGGIIKETAKGIVWFTGLQSVSDKPLGIDKLTLRSGVWLKLGPEIAIEYESFDSTTGSGEKHAKAIFMKVGNKGVITEVFSDFYTVPIQEKAEIKVS
jgi:hypothetical protein